MPGSYLYLKKTKVDWNFTSTRDSVTMASHKHNEIHLTQGKMLGGTGSLDYTGYERGNKHDYNRWAKLTNDQTWSWNSVQPAFHKNENLTDEAILNSPNRRFYGTHGKIKVMKEYFQKNQKYFGAFRELGYDTPLDINPDTPLGFTDVMFNIGDGVRQSTALKFLSPIKNDRNLYVLKNSFVTKIIFDDDKRAIGVKYDTKFNKDRTAYARKEVIVSAGVINSPKLLILSGIGPKHQLKSLGIPVIANLPVGYDFQDHINMILVYKMTKSKKQTILKDPHKYPYTIFDGYVALNPSQAYPDYETFGISLAEKNIFLEFCAFFFDFTPSYCSKLVKKIGTSEILFVVVTFLYPKSRGRISLASTDPYDQPIINPSYFSKYEDVVNGAKYCKHFNQVLNTTYFKNVKAKLILPKIKQCKDLRKDSEEWWRCVTVGISDTSYYYVGTCGMGRVIDSRLRVLGVKNLRVIDSSSFPDTVGTTTLATVVMLAQKGVEFIINEYFPNNK